TRMAIWSNSLSKSPAIGGIRRRILSAAIVSTEYPSLKESEREAPTSSSLGIRQALDTLSNNTTMKGRTIRGLAAVIAAALVSVAPTVAQPLAVKAKGIKTITLTDRVGKNQ